jgi:hypothetical protein
MNHEGTTGTVEVVPSQAAAFVQALASEPSTPPPDGQVGVADAGEGEGTVLRAMEAVVAEAERAAPAPSMSSASVPQVRGARTREHHATVPAETATEAAAHARV